MTSLQLNGFVSGVTTKGNKISILAFEVANTIVKGANLMHSLSKESIKHLKEVVLPSEGVQHLISKDMDELLRMAAADKRYAWKASRIYSINCRNLWSKLLKSMNQIDICILKVVMSVFFHINIFYLYLLMDISTFFNWQTCWILANREELKVFAGEVVRFGNRCKDPQWHNLDRYFDKYHLILYPLSAYAYYVWLMKVDTSSTVLVYKC